MGQADRELYKTIDYEMAQSDGLYLEGSTGDIVLLADGAVVARYDCSDSKFVLNLAETANVPMRAVSGGTSLFGDYLVPGTSVRNGASAPDFTEVRNGLFLPAFAGTGGTTEEAHFVVHVLHDIKAGTTPTFHIHWTHNQASPSGNVKWSIDYSLSRGYEVGTFPAPTTVTTTDVADAQYTHHITDDDDMPMSDSNIEPDAQILCRIYRDPGDAADTFAADAFLVGVDLHYELGQLGSTERNRPFTSIGF